MYVCTSIICTKFISSEIYACNALQCNATTSAASNSAATIAAASIAAAAAAASRIHVLMAVVLPSCFSCLCHFFIFRVSRFGFCVSRFASRKRPKVCVLRQEGSNGDREMLSAFHEAGLEAWDVNMNDLLQGAVVHQWLTLV